MSGFRKLLLSTTVLAAFLSAAWVGAQATHASPAATKPPLPKQLNRLVKQFAKTHPRFPGVALSVRGAGMTWAGSAGFADRASKKPLMTDATFRIASVTKTFTAAAVLRLVEDGKLGLDDPIARRLSPATVAILRSGGYQPDTIKLRHLLQHTSGLYDYAADQAYESFVVSHPRHRWTRAEQVRFAMTHGKPIGAPGARFHYADTGYVLLGEILERATGGGLAAAYRSLLGFDRLGLDETYLETLEPPARHAKPRAHQYLGTLDTTAFDPSFDLYGGGGLVSTVDDLTRFYRALLGGRVFTHPATLRTMLGKERLLRTADLGMGIFSESIGLEPCWAHSGFWGTTVASCRRLGVTMAMTVNQAESFDAATQELEGRLLRLFGGG